MNTLEANYIKRTIFMFIYNQIQSYIIYNIDAIRDLLKFLSLFPCIPNYTCSLFISPYLSFSILYENWTKNFASKRTVKVWVALLLWAEKWIIFLGVFNIHSQYERAVHFLADAPKTNLKFCKSNVYFRGNKLRMEIAFFKLSAA